MKVCKLHRLQDSFCRHFIDKECKIYIKTKVSRCGTVLRKCALFSSTAFPPPPPPPPPPPVGKGGSLASQYRELQWRLFLASKIRGLESYQNPASCHGGSFWRVISAGNFGTFIWRVFMASKSSRYSVGSKKKCE